MTPSARIVGVNTALLSGCGKKGCKEILPEAMWMNIKKDKSHLNILMGHHPINDISDEKIISGQIDSRFHLQISGHRHIQTTNNKQLSFKITSAAFEPECVSSVKDANQYYPVYNVIDIERNDTGYLIKDKPVVWKWNNPCFIEDNAVEFYAFQSNPTSVQTRTKKQNNSSTVSEEPNQELMKVMLQSMGYDHRRQVISRTFDEPISGATENIDTVVDTAENANLTKVLYAATLIKFGESMYQIYSKNTTPKHPKGKSTK